MSTHAAQIAGKRCGACIVGTILLIVLAGCSTALPAGDPSPSVPPSPSGIEAVAFATPVDAHCAWVPAPSASDHAIPAGTDASAGHWEIKTCGAPPGDTTGMGGPVDWRFVPDDES